MSGGRTPAIRPPSTVRAVTATTGPRTWILSLEVRGEAEMSMSDDM